MILDVCSMLLMLVLFVATAYLFRAARIALQLSEEWDIEACLVVSEEPAAIDFVSVHTSQGQQDTEDHAAYLDCAICCAPMSGGLEGERSAALVCGHSYHHECIMAWLQSSRLCPLCRHRVDEPSPPQHP